MDARHNTLFDKLLDRICNHHGPHLSASHTGLPVKIAAVCLDLRFLHFVHLSLLMQTVARVEICQHLQNGIRPCSSKACASVIIISTVRRKANLIRVWVILESWINSSERNWHVKCSVHFSHMRLHLRSFSWGHPFHKHYHRARKTISWETWIRRDRCAFDSPWLPIGLHTQEKMCNEDREAALIIFQSLGITHVSVQGSRLKKYTGVNRKIHCLENLATRNITKHKLAVAWATFNNLQKNRAYEQYRETNCLLTLPPAGLFAFFWVAGTSSSVSPPKIILKASIWLAVNISMRSSTGLSIQPVHPNWRAVIGYAYEGMDNYQPIDIQQLQMSRRGE